MNDTIHIEIKDWDKYNLRTDRKNHTWFRFNNTFFSDQSIVELGHKSQLFYIFLLCETSRISCNSVVLRKSYVCRMFKIRKSCLDKCLKELVSCGAICHHLVSDGSPTLQTDNTNKHTLHADAKKLANPEVKVGELANGEQHQEASKAWEETCAHFKIPSVPFGSDIKIARLLSHYPRQELIDAIVGMRYESANEKYNPSENVNLYRLDKPNVFQKLRNLGAKKRANLENKAMVVAKKTRDELYEEEYQREQAERDPERELQTKKFMEELRAKIESKKNG
jgi:hypothetical protein